MSGGRIALIVVGSLLTLLGLAVTLGGCGLLWADSQRDDDGFWTSGSHRIATPTAALVSEDLDVADADLPFTSDGIEDWVTLRVRASLDDPAGPVFIGVAPTDEVERYLAGVGNDLVEDVEFDPFSVGLRRRPGEPRAPPPGAGARWASSVEGPGARTLEWDLRGGRWTVVVMRADGAPGVAVDVRLGTRIEAIVPIGIGLLVGGLLVLGGGATMIAFGARGRRHDALPAAAIAGAAPGRHPLRVEVDLDPGLSRGLWLVKWLLAIPHLLILIGLWVAFVVTTLVAWIAILITGRYPRGLFDFNVGVLRWSWRVSAYAFSPLSTDRYPPFSLAAGDDHARLEVAYPERLSRGLALVKWWLLAIPHYVVVALISGGGPSPYGWGTWDGGGRWWWAAGLGLVDVLTLVAAVWLLVRASYPRDLLDLLVGLHRWVFRVIAYAALMTDVYPPFRLDQGTREQAAPSAEAPIDGA